MDKCPIDIIKNAVKRKNKKTTQPQDTIRFYTDEKYRDVIPQPAPSHKYLPEWYNTLELQQNNGGIPSEKDYTVRGCMPFFESLSAGWILPLPMDMYIKATENNLSVEFENSHEFGVKITHGGDMFNYNKPIDDAFLAKFITPWYVDAPKGYSIMMLPPLNRWGNNFYEYFMPFSGMFNADSYPTLLNQFALTQIPPGTNTTIKSGTPIAQMIFIDRESTITDAVVTSMSEEDRMNIEKNDVKKSINFHDYNENVHEHIKSSRNLPEERVCPFLNNN
jgi:hypothetical protein